MAERPTAADRLASDPVRLAGGPAAVVDDATMDAFTAEIDRHIEARVAEIQASLTPVHRGADAGSAAAIPGVGIPCVVLAGVFGGHPGAMLTELIPGAIALTQTLRGLAH